MYVVVPEDGEGRERVLHRDLLLPCGFLLVSDRMSEKKRHPRGLKSPTHAPEEWEGKPRKADRKYF